MVVKIFGPDNYIYPEAVRPNIMRKVINHRFKLGVCRGAGCGYHPINGRHIAIHLTHGIVPSASTSAKSVSSKFTSASYYPTTAMCEREI